MSVYTDKRQQKITALQEAIKGNPEPLRQLRSQRGRPYTEEELEQRRQYVNIHWRNLLGHEATREDTIRILGRYDKSGIPGKVCVEYDEGIRAWYS